MTAAVVWIVAGWLGVTFWTAVASRLLPAHIVPDAAIVVVAFLALRREPVFLAAVAVALGYLVGRQAAAPIGVNEVALLLCAIAIRLVVGQLVGGGAAFLAFVSGVAVMGYHLVLYLLLYLGRDAVGFSSWATALLIPSAIATAILAFLMHRPLLWLDTRLTPEKHDTGLTWH